MKTPERNREAQDLPCPSADVETGVVHREVDGDVLDLRVARSTELVLAVGDVVIRDPLLPLIAELFDGQLVWGCIRPSYTWMGAILDTVKYQPLQLQHRPEPFSHQDWLFEIKYDGFRALAQIEHGRCKLVSRNGNEFKSFRTLSESLGTELKRSVVLDGEIVCMGGDGKSRFYDLLFRKGQPCFVAFDLLHCDGQDLTYSPLVERKQRLRAILPTESRSVLYCDHIEANGEELFALACKQDLEGVVAKHKLGPYLQNSAQWFKIRNRKYSQWAGREKFFERERDVDPDMTAWDSCVLACENLSI